MSIPGTKVIFVKSRIYKCCSYYLVSANFLSFLPLIKGFEKTELWLGNNVHKFTEKRKRLTIPLKYFFSHLLNFNYGILHNTVLNAVQCHT